MFCFKCGAQMAQGSRFCTKCGAKFEAQQPGAAAAGLPPAGPPPGDGGGQVWFVHTGGSQKGPFTAAVVRKMIEDGGIDGRTPVWKEGMANWSPAGSIGELSVPGAPAPGGAAMSTEDLKRKDAEARARIKQMMEEEKQRSRKRNVVTSHDRAGGSKPLLGGDSSSGSIKENLLFIIFLLFFCCWPLGLYFLWTSRKIEDKIKIVMTVIWLILTVVYIMAFRNLHH